MATEQKFRHEEDMMARKPAKNKYQKRQHRRGEDRLRQGEVEHYLSLASSSDPQERIIAMEHLCPCHVRKRIDAVWEALYRGLQDPELKVRQAAWHTLEDGGRPNDPKLQPIFEQIAKEETDPRLQQRAIKMIQSAKWVEDKKEELDLMKAHYFSGKCDWCGEANVKVTHDYDTEIEASGSQKRFGLVCEDCNV